MPNIGDKAVKRLHDAAPDLLSACKWAEYYMDAFACPEMQTVSFQKAYKKFKAAIAKAEGRGS